MSPAKGGITMDSAYDAASAPQSDAPPRKKETEDFVEGDFSHADRRVVPLGTAFALALLLGALTFVSIRKPDDQTCQPYRSGALSDWHHEQLIHLRA
jgi:hypothetical protein